MTDTTLADRIRAVRRHGAPITSEQQAAALALLDDLLAAAARHEVTLADLDWIVDVPGVCVDVILAKRDRANRLG
jgi:hypothetical protein